MNIPPEIFLSYAHKDKLDVDELYDILTYKYKLSIWKDTHSIRVGYDFREEIYFGIQNSKLVLACLSQAYIDSKNCLKELKLANNLDKQCIFVVLEDLRIDKIPSISMLVVGEQRCSIYKNRVNNPQSKLWVGDLFKKLTSDIGGIIGKDLTQYDDVTVFKIKKTKEKFHVFLSYSLDIQPNIQTLSQQLEENDLIVHFLSKDQVNDTWKYFMIVKSAIDCSTIFVSCVTKSYLKNKNCFNEIDYAHEIKKPQMVILFEELTKDESFLLNSKCQPPIEQIKVYEDSEKLFLTGHGILFEEILFKIQNLVRKSEPPVQKVKMEEQEAEETANSTLKKIYDLFVTCDDDQYDHVSQFLSKLKPLKKLKIFHAPKSKDEAHRSANYEAIDKSEAVLAVVTSKFQEDEACVAELSYAHRNLKPTSILMDGSVNLTTESEFKEIFKETDVSKIETDLTLLDKDILNNALVQHIEKDLSKTDEEFLLKKENTQNSIKRPSSARPNSSRVVGTAVVSPVSIQKITEHLSFDEAAEKGKIENIKYWLLEGVDINQRNALGRTPLHLAAKGGFIEAVKFIIDHHGNLNEKDVDGRTAIHLAASEGKLDMVKYLYKECGLNVDEQDWRGLTALHLAAQFGYVDVVQYLVNKDAKINQKSKDGWTPLYLAINNKNEVVIKYLRLQGAK